MNTSTYARRQLNPFAGVLQVVESGVARAFSANGILWRIQTVANRPDHTWRSDAGPAPVQQFFNWGMWSARRGMQQVTANPILDIGFMSGAAEELVSMLRREIDRLPFELKDHHELWACDRHGNPLALLDSVITAAEMQQISTHRWCIGAQDEHPYQSPSLATAPSVAAGTRTHADHLEYQVNQHAHAPAWFRRNPDGTLPTTVLSTSWDDPLTAAAVQDYLDWSAPLLLTLPYLPDSLRDRLEHAAMARATLVADLHRVFPTVINAQLIEQARVEARLRRSQ